jgi:hypothetical protein
VRHTDVPVQPATATQSAIAVSTSKVTRDSFRNMAALYRGVDEGDEILDLPAVVRLKCQTGSTVSGLGRAVPHSGQRSGVARRS